MNERAYRISKAIEDAKLSYGELSKITGISKSALQRYATGETEKIPIDRLELIARATDVSAAYLMCWSDIDEISNDFTNVQLDRDVVSIPVLGCIPAGIPIEAIEDIIDYIEIPKKWLAGGKEFFSLKLKGNSMFPEYLSGDIVVFERAETCDTGEDCAVMVNGDNATFKRVERKKNGVVLKPLNPEFETLFFTNEEIENKPVRIIGIARELRRMKK